MKKANVNKIMSFLYFPQLFDVVKVSLTEITPFIYFAHWLDVGKSSLTEITPFIYFARWLDVEKASRAVKSSAMRSIAMSIRALVTDAGWKTIGIPMHARMHSMCTRHHALEGSRLVIVILLKGNISHIWSDYTFLMLQSEWKTSNGLTGAYGQSRHKWCSTYGYRRKRSTCGRGALVTLSYWKLKKE